MCCVPVQERRKQEERDRMEAELQKERDMEAKLRRMQEVNAYLAHAGVGT